MEISDRALAGQRRLPALPWLIAGAAGIVLDRYCVDALAVWLGLAAFFSITTAFGLSLCPQRRALGGPVLLLWLSLAGAWHHLHWSTVAEDDLSAWATDEGAIVRLRGTIHDAPWQTVRPAPIWSDLKEQVWTAATCQVTELQSAGSWQPVSGSCRLSIRAAVPELQPGDQLELLGVLERPPTAANPGDFDFREFLRSQGVHAVLRVENSDCLSHRGLENSLIAIWNRWRQQARRYAGRVFREGMTVETAGIAEALFLGVRHKMDEATRDDFARSGMLHVMAISGVNVGLLAMWFWLGCRLLGCSLASSRGIVLGGLLGYLFLTDADPPVWRATLVAGLGIGAGFLNRTANSRQLIALAAIVVLALNPSDLFHAGAQLSFLSVLIMAEVLRLRAWQEARLREQRGVDEHTLPQRLWCSTKDAFAVSLAIWLLTAPLVAYCFQMISPVGLALNVILSPLILLTMWLGYTLLLVGLVWPALAASLASPLHLALAAFLQCVRWGGQWESGHMAVPAPSLLWLIPFYVFVAGLLGGAAKSNVRRWSLRLLLAWSVCGLGWTLRPPRSGELRMTVLSAGHGLSVVVSLPNGRTLIYDAGSMSQERRLAESTIRSLWRHGAQSADLLIVSHADLDHCNAVPALLNSVSVGGLGVHRSFVDEQQAVVQSVLTAAMSRGVRPILLSAPQSIELDPQVSLKVLHPAPDFQSTKDNANSLVLLLTFAGRSILLSGDLEEDGMAALLKLPPCKVDVLLAPHHGSRRSNPPDLARWANPSVVIASRAEVGGRELLEDIYGTGAACWSTHDSGAIEVTISAGGSLRVEPFKSPLRALP